jgi:hypothetical protein
MKEETMTFSQNIRSTKHSWISMALLLGLLLVSGAPAQAQTQWTPFATPEFEASGAYSFMRATGANSDGFNLNGGSGAFTYNFTHWFAVVGDGGWYHFGGLPAGLTSYMVTYSGGPRITLRNHQHFIAFAQVLGGGARLSATSGGYHAAENGLLIMPGVGVDVALHRNFAIRAIQLD